MPRKFAGPSLTASRGKVCIAHGMRQGGMPQDLLQREDVSAVHDEVAGECALQYVRGLVSRNAQGLLRFRSVAKCRKSGAD
jgi:hypothetical protein